MDANVQEEAAAEGGGLRTRWVELVFGLLLLAGGGVIVYDSVRIGIGWLADGPEAGYFPWLTGSALALAGGWIVASTLFRWRRMEAELFVSWARLKPVLAMLLPSIAYVATIYFLGIYVASAIFIAAFMMWQGHYRLHSALAVGASVPVAMFLLFEIWFLVPLPKGPLERFLGY